MLDNTKRENEITTAQSHGGWRTRHSNKSNFYSFVNHS